MKKIVLLNILVAFTVLFICCVNSQNKQSLNPTIKVPDGKNEILLLSDISSEIEFIVLEENANSFFDYISDFKSVDSLFFFIGNRNLSLFCFKNTGEFVFKINQIGRGPGEYTTITDYAVDKSRSVVSLYDINLRKFFEFDFSGKLLREVKTNWFFREIEWIDEGFLGYATSEYNYFNSKKILPGLILLDTLYNYAEHVQALDDPTGVIIKNSLFYNNGQIFFNPFWESVIYKIENKKLLEYKRFDFGKAEIADKEKYKAGQYSLENLKEEGKAMSTGTFVESKHFSILLESFGVLSNLYFFKENSATLFGRIIINDLVGPVGLNLIGVDQTGVLFYDPENPIPTDEEWIKNFKRNHGTPPGKELHEKFDKISYLGGKIANNVIVKIK